MPKATRKSSDDTEEHGSSAVTNPQEAKDHIMDLEALMKNMKEKIEAGNMTDLLKQTLKNIKTRLVSTFPSLDSADANIVFNAIKDKELKVLLPCMEDTEVLLEELLPSGEVPSASNVYYSIPSSPSHHCFCVPCSSFQLYQTTYQYRRHQNGIHILSTSE